MVKREKGYRKSQWQLVSPHAGPLLCHPQVPLGLCWTSWSAEMLLRMAWDIPSPVFILHMSQPQLTGHPAPWGSVESPQTEWEKLRQGKLNWTAEDLLEGRYRGLRGKGKCVT